MKQILSAFAFAAVAFGAVPAIASPAPTRVDRLGELCESGSRWGCRELAKATNGLCAGPEGSGCRFGLQIVNPGEPMVVVPGLEFLGKSRISTVTFCAKDAGVDDYRDLQTDSEFEVMESCMRENT